jgi:formylaminopyrimidine deformylase / aminopyrimidine aminohydrolase
VTILRSVSAMARAEDALWAAATTSPFLDGVRDGTLAATAFDRWLEQDRLFLVALTRAWSGVIAAGAGPIADLPLLAGGVSAFVAEIEWFDEVASARGLDLGAADLPGCSTWLDGAIRLHSRPSGRWRPPISTRGPPPGADPYRPFVEHWTSPEFATFLSSLEGACDRALVLASDDEVAAAAGAIRTTLRHERAFWDLTLDG